MAWVPWSENVATFIIRHEVFDSCRSVALGSRDYCATRILDSGSAKFPKFGTPIQTTAVNALSQFALFWPSDSAARARINFAYRLRVHRIPTPAVCSWLITLGVIWTYYVKRLSMLIRFERKSNNSSWLPRNYVLSAEEGRRRAFHASRSLAFYLVVVVATGWRILRSPSQIPTSVADHTMQKRRIVKSFAESGHRGVIKRPSAFGIRWYRSALFLNTHGRAY